MKVLTFLNEKGGVGKTTSSTHAAAGLALRGYRVLLVDTDAQANATSMLGVPLAQKDSSGLYKLIVHDADWKEIWKVPNPAVWGGEKTQGTLGVIDSGLDVRTIASMTDDVRSLKDRLDELEGYVDAVVIDTSPTPSLLHSMIYLASDFMVYPSQCELLSLRGLAKSVTHMKRMQTARKAFGLPETNLLGVLPMMYQANTKAHQHGLKMIESKFAGLTWEPITHRTLWRDATFAGKLMFAYAPESEAAQEANQMVDSMVKGILDHAG